MVYLVFFCYIIVIIVKVILRIIRRDIIIGMIVDIMDDFSVEFFLIVFFWLDEGINVFVKFIGNINNFL